jgi:hypothetical protein
LHRQHSKRGDRLRICGGLPPELRRFRRIFGDQRQYFAHHRRLCGDFAGTCGDFHGSAAIFQVFRALETCAGDA